MDTILSTTAEVLPEFAAPGGGDAAPVLSLAELSDLELSVEVPLGCVDSDLRSFLKLEVGSVLQTDRQTGESLEIAVNGTPIARGEVRIHGESFAIRVTEILGASPKRDAEGAAPDVEVPKPQG